jgi:hypothetical protein
MPFEAVGDQLFVVPKRFHICQSLDSLQGFQSINADHLVCIARADSFMRSIRCSLIK